MLWEVRQIHLKKAFSSQKATSNLTQVFLDKKQFLQKSHYCQKAVSGQKVWSILDRSDPKKNQTVISILSINVTTFYNNIFWLVKIQFDQVWSILDRSDPKNIQNKTAIVILFVSVATFYGNIFRLVRNPIWSSLIKFDRFWTDLIQKNQKQNGHFYPFCKCDNFG